MNVYLAGKRVRVSPSKSIGKGGEADVYDIGKGRALKLFKDPTHPDVAGSRSEERAAEVRLALHQLKLPAFPAGLPERVVAPDALATDRKSGGSIVGYSMRLVSGAELIYRFAEPRFRRTGCSGDRVVDVLTDLHATVESIHRAGVVIGDFNDLNVLVEGTRAWIIDSDSFQYGGFDCSVFTQRFVDPLLCDTSAVAPVLGGRYGADSDWYAFNILAMRSLLCCGPYGGVFKPKDTARRVGHATRPLRRITVFDPDVVYPKPAIHYGVLPDELLSHFHRVFREDVREPFPIELLDELRWTTCAACGAQHARPTCPACTTGQAKRAATVSRVRGSVTAYELLPGNPAIPVAGNDDVWIAGGQLMRRSHLGVEVIGDVLEGQTRIWAGERMGFGFYRAGKLCRAFVFDPARRGIDDDIALPRIRGHVVDMTCAVGRDRVWFGWLEQRREKLLARCVVITDRGDVDATYSAEASESTWTSSMRGACAVGPYLFVPTDDGIARIEADGAGIRVTRTFPDTEPFVDASDELRAGPDGLYVIKRDRVVRLTLS